MWPFKKKKKEEDRGHVEWPSYPFTAEQARGMQGGFPQGFGLAAQGQRWATPTLTAQAMAQQQA